MVENNPIYPIVEKLTSIETKLDLLRKDYSKVMFAMLGIIAATLGVKFIGTPPLVHIATYTALLTGMFLLTSTIANWKRMAIGRRLVRLSFATFLFYSVSARILVFTAGIDLPPNWYVPGVDLFFIVISIILMMVVWRRWDGE